MTDLLIGLIIGLAAAVVIIVLIKRGQRGGGKRYSDQIVSSIEEMRSIGQLSVFKVVTKEIVTTKHHWAGAWGKKYLEWLTTSKKMAMIFEFDIDFRYDLRSSEFQILAESDGRYRLVMPPCTHEINIRDISFYDEQRARFLSWLLPSLLDNVFGTGFDEDDRNRLKEEAKEEAYGLAKELVQNLRSDVEHSARQTMEALAKGFDAELARVEFKDIAPAPEQVAVSYEAN